MDISGDFAKSEDNYNLTCLTGVAGNDKFALNKAVTLSDRVSNNNFSNFFQSSQFMLSKEEQLHLWRTAKELDLMPLVVVNALYMLIGVVGNSTVCYVCAIRMPRTVLNNFVLSLAIAELLGCVLIIPLEITKTMNAYNFDYPKLCKTENYLRSFVIYFTNCILIAIATERYQRIVKPHNRHVTMTQFRLTVMGSVTFATLAAIPEAVLAGSQTMKMKFGKGVVCSTYSSDDYAGTVFPPLCACFVVLVYVISTAAIGSIYCVIAVTIWKRGKLQTDRRSRPNTPDLTLRRRVQCFNSNNHSSIMYLPHHQSLPPQRGVESKSEILHGSLDRCELRNVFRPNSDFGMLGAPASSTDNLQIEVEIHQPGSPFTCEKRECGGEEIDGDSPSWFSGLTHASSLFFPNDHFTYQQQSQHENRQRHPHKRDSSNSDNSSRKRISSQRASLSPDPVTSDYDTNYQPDSQSYDEESSQIDHEFNLQQQQQKPLQRKRERRRFTAVFFDELYQTVSRRRERQEVEFFERHGSTEDILTPPSLTPMGSIRSRTGYSRKRTTFIMFVMTTTTAISLFPHTVVLLYRLAHPFVELRLSPDASVLFFMAWNSFFISLACHPYVYGFWNGRFKKALISLFDGLREKTKRKRIAARNEDVKDNNVIRGV